MTDRRDGTSTADHVHRPAATTSTAPGNFASASLPRHLLRGGAGFGALAGSVLLIPAVGPFSLVLAPLGLLALRGCPMCWTIGLVQTVSRGRLRRSCAEGRCELTRREPSDLRGAHEVPAAPDVPPDVRSAHHARSAHHVPSAPGTPAGPGVGVKSG
ncbi:MULTISPECIES: hypothetical protein [unclassified Streptomyces]|uniref:hypothetical protein n=1 Tax=unclassified Streptomyces TaxID=2593676 RepID=UPI00082381ED|nr:MULTISPECIES: hypothetical protein [unclassified Streptomyces]SCK23406.1 hypothetical protein YW7DRAFT_01767 [Streptomyces sp. AmelKG-E11A]